MLVGQCVRCGLPASLGCTVCGRTFCRADLDADERLCADCAVGVKNVKSPVGARGPPSRRLAPRPPALRGSQ
jgi:hypothetical protein